MKAYIYCDKAFYKGEEKMSNLYDNVKNQYPYGDFPSQYTKRGQEELKSKINNPVSVQESPQQKNPQEPKNQQQMNYSQPEVNAQTQNGFNLNSLLPLLFGGMNGDKNFDKDSLLKNILPANSSIPPQLFDMMLNGKMKNKNSEKTPPSSTNVIDTYKKI